MPLSKDKDKPFKETDIVHIQMLKDGKVWLLEGSNDDKIVIKTDAATVNNDRIKTTTAVVKEIDPGAKVTVLQSAELDALRTFIDSYEQIAKAYKEMAGVTYNANEAEAVKLLKTRLNEAKKGLVAPFTKMDALDLKDLKSAVEKNLAGDGSDIKNFRRILRAPGNLEKLGQIVAADLFNDNRDRFVPRGKSKISLAFGSVTIKFRVLSNAGNVFLATNTAGAETSALDYTDPNSVFKDINQPLSVHETGGEIWPGRVLADKEKRSAFAEDIIHDLEKLLNPRQGIAKLKTALGSDSATRLVAGMIKGAQTITAKLKKKYIDPKKETAGIRERYDIISQVK